MKQMTNDRELHFARTLFAAIKGELTGSEVPEVLNDGPRDRFHAGVLLPLDHQIPVLNEGAVGSSHGISQPNADESNPLLAPKLDSESVMSMDFQIRLSEDSHPLALKIKPRFNVYYAVFPTRSEVLSNQIEGQVTAEDLEPEEPGDSEGTSSDPELQKTVPDQELVISTPPSIPQQIAESVTIPLKAAVDLQETSAMLPRKFRRYHIDIPSIDITIDPTRLLPPLEYRDEFDTALAKARNAIANDPELWKHLGAPAEGRRELKGLSLASDSEFAETLRKAAQGETALPTWRAYLTLSGEETLMALKNNERRDVYRLNVALVNSTPSLPKTERQRAQLEEAALFDCSFSVEIQNGELIPFEFQGAAKDYRHERFFDAIGSNCVALTERTGNQTILTTETVPLYEQSWYRTRDDLPVSFAELDDSPNNQILDRFIDLHSRMLAYLSQWDDYLSHDAPSELNREQFSACSLDKQNFADEVERFNLGIEATKNDKDLLRAFRLMNRVFRENGERRQPQITSWRLFQLAFMITQLPTLAAREHDLNLSDDYSQSLKRALERVDVLWFPTGGGKTEAYLGLITTALFYDRLRGKGRGVTAWMRFPLRMLSLQQLERLARVLARAEMIRASEADLHSRAGDPFAIGYYVGGNNTPNKIRESNLPKGKAGEKYLEKQQILRHCPFCDSEVKVQFDRSSWRLAHVCVNEICYTNTSESLGDLKGSLPLFVVDNEIYRYRPAVLVGTVDKLAVLGFQKHFAHLMSSVTQRCKTHGYLSFGQCIENIGGGPCTAKPRTFSRLQPEKDPIPAFLIQDELHLLKEELGTFNAHYEGFLQQLAKKQELLPSKILAATATIEAYETQTFHLYLKNANRFPKPSWRAGESFYATSTPIAYRRLYCGVLTHQRSPDNTVLRALEVYHRLISGFKASPAEALRTLDMEEVRTDEFLDFLRLYDLSLTYVNRKATGGNIAYGLNQTVSPRLKEPLVVDLLTGDNTMTEVGDVIERIERERDDTGESRLDALIATSLISHGVDLERINFLSMAGMPSRYAEYIQASSRAARNHVGLVLVCFKRFDLRERSQYHYFLPNHRYLDRLVEPVPINRFSAFAAQRTVPGLLAGLLLSHYSRGLFYRGVITKSLDNLRQLKEMIDEKEITIDQIRSDLEAIIGVSHPQLSSLQSRYMTEEIEAVLQTNWDQITRSYDTFLSDAIRPMSSFRDVDETIDFVADGPASVFVERVRS